MNLARLCRRLVTTLSLVVAASAPAQTPPDPARPVQIWTN